jgi:hypothetical protein
MTVPTAKIELTAREARELLELVDERIVALANWTQSALLVGDPDRAYRLAADRNRLQSTMRPTLSRALDAVEALEDSQ